MAQDDETRSIVGFALYYSGGRHGGSYYKVLTSTQGTVKVVDLNTYKPSAGEKATIINKSEE